MWRSQAVKMNGADSNNDAWHARGAMPNGCLRSVDDRRCPLDMGLLMDISKTGEDSRGLAGTRGDKKRCCNSSFHVVKIEVVRHHRVMVRG